MCDPARVDQRINSGALVRCAGRLRTEAPERDGLLIRGDEQPWLELESGDVLESFSAASIQYGVALGAYTGQRTRTLRRVAPVSRAALVKPLTVGTRCLFTAFHLKTGQWP